MAALPPLTQLLGNHGPLLEGYWSMLDPSNSGKIDAGSAAMFLKKSQLREPVLHKIWNMSDPDKRGWLDKQGLFMALRLISVCQAGKDPSVASMSLTDPPPKLVGVEVTSTNKWTIEAAERTKYEQVFQSLQPNKGLLGGDRAKPFMMTTKLPLDVLGKVWNLSDIDQDGSLDLDEFCVAMKLMALAGAKEVLPAVLPSSLVPPSKTPSSASPGGTGGPSAAGGPSATGSLVGTTPIIPPPMGRASPKPSSSPAHNSPVPYKKSSPYSSAASLVPTPVSSSTPSDDPEWVVSAELKTKYDGYFQGIDKDHDGYISGDEARSLFMASNLPSSVLAHVWNLCDLEGNGRLNSEQFALAMYLIAEKVRKKDIPQEMTAAMIPPSLRGKIKAPPPSSSSSVTASAPLSSVTSAAMTTSEWVQMTSSLTPTNDDPLLSAWATSSAPPDRLMKGFSTDFSAIQELDSITNEIQSIRKEKVELVDDIKNKQELVQQRKVELEDLQTGVSSATDQREKLERDREEARRLLEHLDAEKAKYESQIAELKQNCDDEKEEIEKLKQQLSEQEIGKRSQEEELQTLEEQLEQLKKEETEYRHKVELSKAELEKLQKHNHSVQLDITQVRQKIEMLKEEHQSLATALTLYPPTNITPGSTPSSSVININDVGQLSAELHVPHMSDHDAVSARATVGSSSPVSSLSGFSTNSHLDEGPEDGGGKEDKALADPFASTSSAADPFAAFSLPTSVASSDPFGGRAFSGKPSDLSAFDPFGGGSDPFKTSAPATGEDLFKSDPFGAASSASPLPPSSLPQTSTMTDPSPARAVDPFSGQDPFNSDPFSSNDKQASPWGVTGGFDVDPFGQQNVRTPTDPFAGGDPFGDDPFGMKSGGGTTNGSTNPFGGGDSLFGGGQGDS